MKSKRQQRKQDRAHKVDKNGLTMALSRRQRRALNRRNIACTYANAGGGGAYRIGPGESTRRNNYGISQDTTQLVYGGGSMKAH